MADLHTYVFTVIAEELSTDGAENFQNSNAIPALVEKTADDEKDPTQNSQENKGAFSPECRTDAKNNVRGNGEFFFLSV